MEECAICVSSDDEYVHKGYLSGLFLLHGELDAWVLLVEVLQEYE